MLTRVSLLLVLSLAIHCVQAEELPLADVFVSGTEGFHTYRIPALVVSKQGTLLAFCEGRKTGRSDHGDLDLVLRRSTDGGKTWQPLQLVYEEGETKKITIGNPCPVVDGQTSTIWLPFTRDNDDVLVTSSNDDGRTWSPPREITSDVKRPDWSWYATGPGNAIQLSHGPHRGRLVIPCDHRQAAKETNPKFVGRSHVIYSDDHGKSWKLGGVTELGMNECAVVELTNGTLMLNMRSYLGRGCRGVATSRDGGLTWSAVQDAQALIEPVCQASFIRYSDTSTGDANVLLFSNPASTKGRHQLTIRLSNDEGRTWPVSRQLYAGSAAYSCLCKLPDGRIGILFERDDYSKISFTAFDLEWLRGEPR